MFSGHSQPDVTFKAQVIKTTAKVGHSIHKHWSGHFARLHGRPQVVGQRPFGAESAPVLAPTRAAPQQQCFW